VNSKRIPPNTAIPLHISDLICFGPTNKFLYTFRTYHTNGSSSNSGAGSSGLTSGNSGEGRNESRLSAPGSSGSGTSVKVVV